MPSFRRKPVDVVVDVRSKLEYWMGHLPGAICLPVDKIADAIGARPEIGKDSRVLVYCASGARSRIAADTLKALGYRRVTDGGAISTARPEFVA